MEAGETMYNRYIPQPDGSYRRDPMPEPQNHRPEPCKQDPPKQEPACPPPPPHPCRQETPKPDHRCQQNGNAGDFLRRLLPQNLDTGDLIVILLLLLMAGDCAEDRNAALLTLAIYLFM